MAGTFIKTHQTVAAQQNFMLNHQGGYHAGSYCEVARGLIGAKKTDAQADARRSLQRGRFANTTSGSKRAFPLAHGGCGPHREHAIQDVAPDEGLWKTSAEECHETQRRKSVSSAVYRDRGKRSVDERNDAADETRAVF